MGLNPFESAKDNLARKISAHRPLTDTEVDAVVDEVIAQNGKPTEQQQEVLDAAGLGELFKPDQIH
jgi:hypothetical protein